MLKNIAILFALVVVLHPTPTAALVVALPQPTDVSVGSPSAVCWDDIVASMKRPGCRDTLVLWAQKYPNDATAVKIQSIVANETAAQTQATDQKEAEQKQEVQEKVDQKLKIKELEERVSELEAQSRATSTQLQYGAKKTLQTLPVKNAEVKTVPNTKKEIGAAEQIVSTANQDIPPTPPKKMSWWERLLSWFKK